MSSMNKHLNRDCRILLHAPGTAPGVRPVY
jgi:hypothetical protein